MYLRSLEKKDAPLMFEWMHDENVICGLLADFKSKGIKDCEAFITASLVDEANKHFAIVDDNDEYQGTVSLKHIENGCAEFAIAIRSTAMGKGFSIFAIKEIIEFGKNKLGLSEIYWCVNKDNFRAIRFYDKCGYKKVNANQLKTDVRGGGTLWSRLNVSIGIRFNLVVFADLKIYDGLYQKGRYAA